VRQPAAFHAEALQPTASACSDPGRRPVTLRPNVRRGAHARSGAAAL
jgi:hypothetical protein